jgi:hypothetical protein
LQAAGLASWLLLTDVLATVLYSSSNRETAIGHHAKAPLPLAVNERGFERGIAWLNR